MIKILKFNIFIFLSVLCLVACGRTSDENTGSEVLDVGDGIAFQSSQDGSDEILDIEISAENLEGMTEEIVKTEKDASIYAKPSENASVIGAVDARTNIGVYGLTADEEWMVVVFNGRIGYVDADAFEREIVRNQTVIEPTPQRPSSNQSQRPTGNNSNTSNNNNNNGSQSSSESNSNSSSNSNSNSNRDETDDTPSRDDSDSNDPGENDSQIPDDSESYEPENSENQKPEDNESDIPGNSESQEPEDSESQEPEDSELEEPGSEVPDDSEPQPSEPDEPQEPEEPAVPEIPEVPSEPEQPEEIEMEILE